MAKDDDFVNILFVNKIPSVLRIREKHAILSGIVAVDHIVRFNIFFHIQRQVVTASKRPILIWAPSYPPDTSLCLSVRSKQKVKDSSLHHLGSSALEFWPLCHDGLQADERTVGGEVCRVLLNSCPQLWKAKSKDACLTYLHEDRLLGS